MLFCVLRSRSFTLFTLLSALHYCVDAFTGSEYALDTEYLGANFFDGWDFYTGRDPTGGFVTYYSRSSSQLAGLVNSSNAAPAYIGVDYVNELPVTPAGRADGAGRPSVRISTQRSWTHGLIIGDFNHAPSGICGTWPAFWTLGPNWPYTGEVDVMEAVNKAVSNAVSLHTNETCIISSNSTTQLGTLSNTNCAYYPDYNVGCGVVDNRPASYSDFNLVGGGVYAMQWTSEYIRVWFFPRQRVPQDITDKNPDPSSWGLPAANFMGNCTIDQHFQQHKIVFDTTFCGEYAGNPYVWNSTVNSCATDTGYATCDAFVAKNPAVFREAYWSINYVRVYQLVDPATPAIEPQYIASLQPANTVDQLFTSQIAAPSPTASLCPTYNFTVVRNGNLTYEVECDFDPPGPDLPPPYPNYRIRSLEDCVAGCTYWNTINGTNLCGAVAYDESIPFCYFKKYIDQPPRYRKGFAGARLIYYGYPEITDDPRSQTASSTSSFVEIIPTPQYYRPSSTLVTSSNTFTSFSSTTVPLQTVLPPPLGTTTNGTVRPTLDPGTPTVSYSGTISVPVTTTTSTSQIRGEDSISVVLSKPSTTSKETNPSTVITSEPSSITSTVIVITSGSGFSTTTSTLHSPQLSSVLPATTSSTTYIFSGTNSISGNPPGPTSFANFEYLGCKASLYGRHVFGLSESSTEMTVERCIRSCRTSYYAALHGSDCYCINTLSTGTELVTYSDSVCNIPCPGNADEHCGGVVVLNKTRSDGAFIDSNIATKEIEKRQPSDSSVLDLFSVYYNMLLAASEIPTTTSLTLTTSPITLDSVTHMISNLNTLTVTTVVTTWCDFCATCPGYLGTLTTTITVPVRVDWAGTTATNQAPLIPMSTTTRRCKCGVGGATSSVVVTIPHKDKVAALTSSALQIHDSQAPGAPAGIESTNPYYSSSNTTWGYNQLATMQSSSITASRLPGLTSPEQSVSIVNKTNMIVSGPSLMMPTSLTTSRFPMQTVFAGDATYQIICVHTVIKTAILVVVLLVVW